MTDPYNINRPPHLVANELIRAIEGYLWQGGVGIKFGEEGHSLIEDFVHQYNLQVERYYDESAKSYIENQQLLAQVKADKARLDQIWKLARLDPLDAADASRRLVNIAEIAGYEPGETRNKK